MTRVVLFLCGSLAVFLPGCATVDTAPPLTAPALIPGEAAAPSQVTPSEAVAIAEIYARHPWRPFARNMLHGTDANGVRVDTPDIGYKPHTDRDGWWVPGEVNRGIPYKWGGFDDPASFDAGVGSGLAAGDVSTPEKRRLDTQAVSSLAVGVDCSGFVSRCLKLPRVYDTTQLPMVCDLVRDVADIRPGDVLNIPRRHALLIAGWARRDRTWVYYYETGGVPDWKPDLKEAPLDKLLALGYQVLRYRGMAREAVPTGKQVLTRDMRSRAVVISDPVIGEP